MTRKFTKISDILTQDFFEKLGEFIFKEDFDSFYSRKMNENPKYTKSFHRFWMNEEYMDSYSEEGYPLSFELFLDMYKSVKCCANIIDKKLFYIKYLTKEIFEKDSNDYLNTSLISIKLNKGIIEQVYYKKFVLDLYNSTFADLESLYAFRNKYLLFTLEKSLDLYCRNILLSVFEYIQAYLESILINLINDTKYVLLSYIGTTRKDIMYPTFCNKSEKFDYFNAIIEQAKHVRCRNMIGIQGRNARSLGSSFPKNGTELKKVINLYQKAFKKYKKDVNNIMASCYSEKRRTQSRTDARCELLEYLYSNNVDIILSEIILNYFDSTYTAGTITFADAIAYTFVVDSEELFKDLECPELALRQMLKRRVVDKKPLVITREKPQIYNTDEFITLKRAFFKNIDK